MWEPDELAAAAGGQGYGKERRLVGVCIDSRAISPGALFLALQGTRVDGHDFVEEAITRGAAAVVVSRHTSPQWLQKTGLGWQALAPQCFVIEVEDTLTALQRMAAWHRLRFDIPLIGVTGSNGKTTTKDMIAAILSRSGGVCATAGNLNNHIGLPLSLLGLTASHRVAVIEIGISRPGEMKTLCEIARPTIGLVTNIGPAHLEFLGDLEGVAREKKQLFDGVSTRIVNLDDPYMSPMATQQARAWTYSQQGPADVAATHIRPHTRHTAFRLAIQGQDCGEVALATFGRHQVSNALAATSAALSVGTTISDIIEGLAQYQPSAMRMQTIHAKGFHVLLDAYNANPDSMKAAITALCNQPGRKLALLGDMLELGIHALDLHREVGRFVAACGVNRLIAVGQWASAMVEGAQEGGLHESAAYPEPTAAQDALQRMLQPDDWLLIKGSRGLKMETVLPVLGL